MTFTLTPINVKKADGTSTPMVAYNDGTNNAFANAQLDATGAVISPATSGLQTTANSALATLVTQTNGLATAAAQTTANTSLAATATNTGNLDTNLGAKADVAASSDTGTFSLIALFKRALQTLASILTACQAATPAGANLIGRVGIDQTTPGTTNLVQVGGSLPAGTAVVGKFATDQTTHGTTDLVAADVTKVGGTALALGQAVAGSSIPVVLPAAQITSLSAPVLGAGTNAIGSVSAAANTAGGTSTFAATGGTGNALLTNAATAVKAAAGNLYGVSFVNTGATAAYVQAFDTAAGSVTLGTTAPKMVFWVPAGGSWEEKFTNEAKVNFATAITLAATLTATGSAAPATGVLATVIYK